MFHPHTGVHSNNSKSTKYTRSAPHKPFQGHPSTCSLWSLLGMFFASRLQKKPSQHDKIVRCGGSCPQAAVSKCISNKIGKFASWQHERAGGHGVPCIQRWSLLNMFFASSLHKTRDVPRKVTRGVSCSCNFVWSYMLKGGLLMITRCNCYYSRSLSTPVH